MPSRKKELSVKDAEEMANDLHKEQREGTIRALQRYKNKQGEIVPEEVVGEDIAIARAALERVRERGTVDFYNVEEVIVRTEEYFKGCEISGTFPSIMGLCAKGFGCTRDRLNSWVADHPDSPTGQYIGIVKEMIADVLTNASLKNKANVAQTIFQLKNHFGHMDEVKVTKTEKSDSLLIGASTEKDIMERYKESVVWDD